MFLYHTGPLRFRPPQPVEPWSGIHNATAWGHVCPQLIDNPKYQNWQEFIDEDCLSLNIFKPQVYSLSKIDIVILLFCVGQRGLFNSF